MKRPELESTIARMVDRVATDERSIGVLSTGEYLAVALVLDRPDLLAAARGKYTMLEAIERLGPEWTKAAINVQKSRESCGSRLPE